VIASAAKVPVSPLERIHVPDSLCPDGSVAGAKNEAE
jgi:hypothetical protein